MKDVASFILSLMFLIFLVLFGLVHKNCSEKVTDKIIELPCTTFCHKTIPTIKKGK